MNVEKMYTSIDAHVSGEAFRVIVHSPFQLLSQKVSEYNQTFDPFVKQAKALLLKEPRGYRGMNGSIVLPSSEADFGVIFLNHEQEEHFTYSGLIATLTVMVETGQIPVKEDGNYQIETIKGIYSFVADVSDHVVNHVQIDTITTRVLETNDEVNIIEVDESRKYYLYSLPESIPTLSVNHLSVIMEWGKEAAKKLNDTAFNGIVLVEKRAEGNVRSVTFETDGEILRSPGFDSSCAICMSQMEDGESISALRNESIFGSELHVVMNDTANNRFTIKKQGFVTGEHRFIFDSEDPLKHGFLLK